MFVHLCVCVCEVECEDVNVCACVYYYYFFFIFFTHGVPAGFKTLNIRKNKKYYDVH